MNTQSINIVLGGDSSLSVQYHMNRYYCKATIKPQKYNTNTQHLQYLHTVHTKSKELQQ